MYQILFKVYGDDGITPVAYLGGDADTNEMRLSLNSKSKTNKRGTRLSIEEHGGRFDSFNKMRENVVRIAVGSDGGGIVDVRDKYGYVR